MGVLKFINNMRRNKIAIFSFAGIGNSILSIPIIKLIRKKYSFAQLDLITTINPVYQLFNNQDYLSNVI